VDRSDDMRIFAKVVESGSFAGTAARLNIAASKLRHPSIIATAAWPKASDAPSRNRKYVTKAQESQHRPPRTEGVAYKQPALECGVGRRARE
jgi:hypothetical protein